MLWSILKILAFLAIAVALAFGASWILATPGQVTIAFDGREFTLTPIGALVGLVVLLAAVFVLLKLLGLLLAVMRFLLGDETAISRYFSRNRERKGFSAYSDGMLALASGDSKGALRKAQRADRLLDRPELTKLLAAQAAEMGGDRDKAFDAYKQLLPDDRTRAAGIEGLARLKRDEGDLPTAMALAKKAVALRPDNERMLRMLFDLQTRQHDWAGARETLTSAMHARQLPRDVGTRRDAVLSLADAQAAAAAGNQAGADEAAIQANRLAPTLIPAAVLAAQAQARTGNKRKATRILTTAWAGTPHPDIAEAFAGLEPDETPAQRRKRFATLVSAAPGRPESRMVETALAIKAEDFPAARRALGSLAEDEPTARNLTLLAAIERGQGAPDAVVSGWLAKAITASRGPRWVCTNCTGIQAAWTPVCEHCGAFDTLDWRTPPHAEDQDLAEAAMLPLVTGTLDEPPAAAPEAPAPKADVRPDGRSPEVEDAVLASVADNARVAGAN
ncbi:MAG: heme biosynthesis HemY N-terminal domain-containing protein [Amaricoccus sp.]|uniref:heme biosynthesis protein HemY n=1 Tax=Amaricoccus sp. TaxID=1872485 RepID=UPI0039E51880